MKINIIRQEKNSVFNRQEIIAEVEEKITPKRTEVQEKLAAALNIPKSQVVIIKMDTRFGTNKLTIEARAYDSEETMKSVEAKHIQKRNFKEEPKTKENETANEPEKPVEEKKE
jgi:ribosomal protein S24E